MCYVPHLALRFVFVVCNGELKSMEGEEGPTANVVVVETGVANIGSILHMLQRLGAKVSLRHFLKIVKNQAKYRLHFPCNARFSICA